MEHFRVNASLLLVSSKIALEHPVYIYCAGLPAEFLLPNEDYDS